MKVKTEKNKSHMILWKHLEEVIERDIRPLLREHHGDIVLRDVQGKDVRVALLGACRTCPAAQMTIEQTVQRILTEQLGDEIGQVILVNETDPELLDFAKQLLNRKKKDIDL